MEPLGVGHRPQRPEENTSCLLGGQAVNRPGYDEAPRLGVVLEGRESGKEPRTVRQAQEGNKVRFS